MRILKFLGNFRLGGLRGLAPLGSRGIAPKKIASVCRLKADTQSEQNSKTRGSGSKNQAPRLRGEFCEISRKASRGAVSAVAAAKILR